MFPAVSSPIVFGFCILLNGLLFQRINEKRRRAVSYRYILSVVTHTFCLRSLYISAIQSNCLVNLSSGISVIRLVCILTVKSGPLVPTYKTVSLAGITAWI